MKVLEAKTEVAGFFKIESYKVDATGGEVPGSRKLKADWFRNLILDQGFNLLAVSEQFMNACQVGSGSTSPAPGDSALAARVAGTSTIAGSSVARGSTAPYYVALTRTYRFATGVATGNLSEVGVGETINSGLFSRSLIKDPMGAPTTITVLSDESLDVTYEFRYYAPGSDVTGSIVATGSIGGTYDYTMRAANVTLNANSDIFGWSLPVGQNAPVFNSSSFRAYSGAIGPVTGSPSGTEVALSGVSPRSYANGSFVLDWDVNALAPNANIAGGIKSMMVKLGIGTYQIEFTPAIPKTATDVVQLTLRLSWARRP